MISHGSRRASRTRPAGSPAPSRTAPRSWTDPPIGKHQEEDTVEIIRNHILLRQATGLDRSEPMGHRAEFLKEVAAIFGEDAPPARYVQAAKAAYGEDHPMVLAAAYDAWCLGDYRDAKAHLIRHLGFEPSAPPISFT